MHTDYSKIEESAKFALTRQRVTNPELDEFDFYKDLILSVRKRIELIELELTKDKVVGYIEDQIEDTTKHRIIDSVRRELNSESQEGHIRKLKEILSSLKAGEQIPEGIKDVLNETAIRRYEGLEKGVIFQRMRFTVFSDMMKRVDRKEAIKWIEGLVDAERNTLSSKEKEFLIYKIIEEKENWVYLTPNKKAELLSLILNISQDHLRKHYPTKPDPKIETNDQRNARLNVDRIWHDVTKPK